jgi:hypothetical protein
MEVYLIRTQLQEALHRLTAPNFAQLSEFSDCYLMAPPQPQVCDARHIVSSLCSPVLPERGKRHAGKVCSLSRVKYLEQCTGVYL